uniref:Uncharacterized protein n=1 Tax=Cynoglossus semilaevis TaxID=244447 RepID=A0A3P8VQ27_CYNSE
MKLLRSFSAHRMKRSVSSLSREKSAHVQSKLRALLQRRDRIKELSVKRRQELELSRMLCIFNRDVAQRMLKMTEAGKAELSDLQTKMKLLQKHQVFEAEILAHSEIINNELVSLFHPKSKEVKKSTAALKLLWEELRNAVASRGIALEANRDFLEFLQKVEKVEAWIRHKVRRRL